MKAKITHKKKQTKVDFEDKFLKEQKYAEQNFHLVDTTHEVPEYIDEKGIGAEEKEQESENEELKQGEQKIQSGKKS